MKPSTVQRQESSFCHFATRPFAARKAIRHYYENLTYLDFGSSSSAIAIFSEEIVVVNAANISN